MNAEIRKQIAKLTEQLANIQSEIEAIRDEEQEKYDNLPEGLQMSERGEKFESAIEALDYAATSIEECLEHLDDAVE